MEDNLLPESQNKSSVRKLTIIEFKAHPGCHHYSDEEAEEITQTLFLLAITLVDRMSIQSDINICYLNKAA